MTIELSKLFHLNQASSSVQNVQQQTAVGVFPHSGSKRWPTVSKIKTSHYLQNDNQDFVTRSIDDIGV